MGGCLIISKVTFVLFALIFTLVGICCFLVVPAYIFNEINKRDYLGKEANGSFNEMLQKYVKPPYTMQLEIWTFSVTNSEDVVNNGAKPHLVEKGPYVFVETQDKNVAFKNNSNNTRLLYRNNRHYFHNLSMSCGDCKLSDAVILPSIVFQKIVDIVANITNKYLLEVIDIVLRSRKETAYSTVSVGDLLFYGFKDPLISSFCDNRLLKQICVNHGIPERIGLMYGHNNTDDGIYEISTGFNDVMSLGHVYSWNGMSGNLSTKYWFGKGARMINGTDAQLFPPKELLKREKFQIFTGQACRSIEMAFQELTYVKGLPANRYSPSESMGDVKLQRELGFCSPNTPTYFNNTEIQEPGCLPSGLIDMGGCVPDASRIYASNAHFLDSPDALRDALEGLPEPNRERDAIFIDIEPMTGVVVHAESRSQLNLGVLRGNIGSVANMPNATIVPLIWMNESVIFDDTTRAQLFQAVNALRYSNIFGVVFIILGVMLFVGFLLVVFVSRRQKTRHHLFISSGHSDDPIPNADTSFFDDEISRGVVNANYEPTFPTAQQQLQVPRPEVPSSLNAVDGQQ